MDIILLIRGLIAGLFATLSMMAIESLAWAHFGLKGVIEWEENQSTVARLLRKSEGASICQGLALHFIHGIIAGLTFVLVVMYVGENVQYGALVMVYALGLWLFGLAIYKPITGRNLEKDRVGLAAFGTNLASHLLYGAVLGLLVVWP